MKTARGEVWVTDYGRPLGREQGYPRPAIVLSGSLLNTERMGLAVAVPLTSRRRDWPSHVQIAPGGSGLRETSWAMTEQVRSVSTLRLAQRIGIADTEEVDRISRILRRLLEM